MQTLIPIIKPVSLSCNLSCSYCYYGPPRKEDFRPLLGASVDRFSAMTDQTVRQLIAAFAICEPLPEFIWHGGEPLLAGIPFYEKVVQLQNELLNKREYRNSIQTNATLVTREWALFFASNKFNVGVSFDGTLAAHNTFRVSNSGSGSADRAIAGILKLQEAGIKPSVICTVTRANTGRSVEAYSFLRSLGITRMKFSHLHERERLGDRSSIAADPMTYAEFLVGIMDAWIAEDNPEVEISELRSIVQILTGGADKDCIFAGVCDRYLTIEYDGAVSWCDTIGKPREIKRFGHIRDGLEAITSSREYTEFQQQLHKLRETTRHEPWYRFISFGCIGDYPTLPFESTEAKNTYADSWMHLVRAVANRLQKHNFQLSLNP